jgi:hypothetical protein
VKLKKLMLAAAFAAVSAASQAGVVIVTDTSVVDSIPGLTGFTTDGAMMDGLLVTATFSNGFSQTLAWADTGAASGGVSGNGWSLSEDGNTYGGIWNFLQDASQGQIVSLKLDASGPKQVTVFDTTFGFAEGTPNSASGMDFAFSTCDGCNATATYSNAIAVAPGAAVGDIFHTLLITFDQGQGPRTPFSFVQDTDNDSRLTTGFVPEPGTAPLMALALLGMGAALRRRRS